MHEHVSADALFQPMADRTDVQVDRLEASKSPFHHREGFVGAHRGVVVDGVQAGRLVRTA